MKIRMKKILLGGLVISMFVSGVFTTKLVSAKKAEPTLSKKVVILEPEQKMTLKINGVSSKKIKWESTNKKVATVKNGKVHAKKIGKCKIIARYLKKKYTCTVKVIKERKSFKQDPTVTNTVKATGTSSMNETNGSTGTNGVGTPATSQEPVAVTQTAIPIMSQPPVTNDTSKKITLNICKYEQENQILGLTIHNGSDANIEVGYAHFTLYRLENNIWTKVPQLEKVPETIELAFIVKPNEDWSENISLKEYYGQLPSGQYRISKTMYPDNIYVDFSIQNPI